MAYYLIMSKSLTYAQKTAKVLERAGVTAIIMRPPRGLSKDGCTYSVKISEHNLSQALAVMNTAGLTYSHVFIVRPDGTSGEVEV